MKKIFCFLSSIILISMLNANSLLTPYFENGELDEKKALAYYEESKASYLKDKSDENAVTYIDSCRVLSCYYAGGVLLKKGRLVKSLQNEIQQLVDFNNVGGEVSLSYADFLFSEFFWKMDNQDVNQIYPLVCRRALMSMPGNKEVMLKFALWIIFSCNSRTNNWNTFIRNCEKDIENLNDYDKFNAYIQYSSFYMKTNDTLKGFMYLDKARELYPNNVLCSVLEKNYKDGKLGL